MSRVPKSEFRGRTRGIESGEEPRVVKRDPGSRRHGVETEEAESSEPSCRGVSDRRVLRSRYLAVKNLIRDKREDISNANSDKFNSIFSEVESLHELVQKPREQVADAEALLGIAESLATSVKAQNSEGVTPSDFITCLLQNFTQRNGAASMDQSRLLLGWNDIGLDVCHIFMKVSGCCTMLGPMNVEVKQRKAAVQRKRTRPTTTEHPEDLDNVEGEEKTDTDRNMATMFDILKKKRRVMLENLVLNRNSFAQTVENLFALSFLIKDGRVEVNVDANGYHLVSAKNAPSADKLASGEASYYHYVFRFDFKDWKLMKDVVTVGEELMPHRNSTCISNDLQGELVSESQGATVAAQTTPIRKFSRNRGLVIQEDSVVEDSPENDNPNMNAVAIRKGKRKLR